MASPDKKTLKWLVNKVATCHECNFESHGRFAERDARQHALDTGHIPTLEVAYDISKASVGEDGQE